MLKTGTQAEQGIPLVIYRGSRRPEGVKPKDLEMLECGNEDCHWRGFEKQLLVTGLDDAPVERCPKCEGTELGAIVRTARDFNYKTRAAGGLR